TQCSGTPSATRSSPRCATFESKFYDVWRELTVQQEIASEIPSVSIAVFRQVLQGPHGVVNGRPFHRIRDVTAGPGASAQPSHDVAQAVLSSVAQCSSVEDSISGVRGGADRRLIVAKVFSDPATVQYSKIVIAVGHSHYGQDLNNTEKYSDALRMIEGIRRIDVLAIVGEGFDELQRGAGLHRQDQAGLAQLAAAAAAPARAADQRLGRGQVTQPDRLGEQAALKLRVTGGLGGSEFQQLVHHRHPVHLDGLLQRRAQLFESFAGGMAQPTLNIQEVSSNHRGKQTVDCVFRLVSRVFQAVASPPEETRALQVSRVLQAVASPPEETRALQVSRVLQAVASPPEETRALQVSRVFQAVASPPEETRALQVSRVFQAVASPSKGTRALQVSRILHAVANPPEGTRALQVSRVLQAVASPSEETRALQVSRVLQAVASPPEETRALQVSRVLQAVASSPEETRALQSPKPPSFPAGGSLYTVWEYPIEEQYTDMFRRMSGWGFFNTTEEALSHVSTGQWAMFMETPLIKYYMGKDCDLTSTGEILSSRPYGIALQKNSPLTSLFNMAILNMQNDRSLESFKVYWWEREKVQCSTEKVSSGVQLKTLSGVFVLLGAGIGAGFVVLIVEFVVAKVWGTERFKPVSWGLISEQCTLEQCTLKQCTLEH
uniref:PBPe domain-containing protein n=1 Tax=Macrostomum lignano TaxID=282301 RepID=A0A1I8H7G5_9PLAT